MPNRWILVLLLPLLFLGGCASVGSFRGLKLDDESVYVAGLPPLLQDNHYSCGAVCVAAVAASLDVPPERFRAKHPALAQDLSGRELTALAEELGLQAFAYRGSPEDLEQNLRKGRPVIVMIPQALIPDGALSSTLLLTAWNEWGPKPAHWVVVLGITKNKSVILHDPASGPMTIKPEVFHAWWAKKEHLSVLIVRP